MVEQTTELDSTDQKNKLIEQQNAELKKRIEDLENKIKLGSQKNEETVLKETTEISPALNKTRKVAGEDTVLELVRDHLGVLCGGRDGCFPSSDLLPTVREIACENGVHLATNASALKWLERNFEGVRQQVIKRKKTVIVPMDSVIEHSRKRRRQ